MKEVLIEGEGLTIQEGSLWIGRGGGSTAVVIPLNGTPGGNEASITIDYIIVLHTHQPITLLL